MEPATHDEISQRAYEIWETEGRPNGRHQEHWLQAQKELTSTDVSKATDLHPGMMGDGTEEQNLNQAGIPGARITQEEVEEAFALAAGA